jgi:GAF domain-containing protein
MSDRVVDGPEEFNRQLAEAARSMQVEIGTQATLDQAISNATQIVDGCDLVGISIAHKDGIDTPAGSDEATRRIDELQYALGQGPCFDALREHHTVHSADLARDDRWPEWGPRMAQELGVVSTVSYRLYVTGSTIGVLNLYSRTVDGFDGDDIENGRALAAHVAVAVAGAQDAEHLERALVNRTLIGQAEGILMERFDISPDQAFGVLRRISQGRNIKLNKVAEELVRTRQTPQ